MPVWPILPLAVITVLFFRKLFLRRYQIVPFCAEVHLVGPILLKHYARVPCDLALRVAQYAQDLWEELGVDFPQETNKEFVLSVIHDSYRGPGWMTPFKSEAVINLAVPPPLGSEQANFEVRRRMLRGIIAEELHHLARARRFGEEKYEFRPGPKAGHLETVTYYAVNGFEYEVLKFCVRATGDRADLLAEVEEYRSRKSVASSQ